MNCESCNGCTHENPEIQVDVKALFQEQYAHLEKYAALKDAVDDAEKDVLIDAIILRFTRTFDLLMALAYGNIKDRGIECESEDQFMAALMDNDIFDEKEAEALFDVLQVSLFLSEAGDDEREQVYEIMDEIEMYVKAIGLFALKLAA